MSANFSTPSCLNKTIPYQQPGSLNYILSAYVFPFICLAGILGAILNLTVLNGKGMRTKTNCFLSAMAFADCCFFATMFVPNLIVYEYFALSDNFLALWYSTKMPLNAMANWLSSLSIWFAVMVTLERLIAIRSPLHAHLIWQRYKPKIIIVIFCALLFIMQIYSLLILTPKPVPNCVDHSKLVYIFKRITPADLFFKFVMYSLIVVPTITVTIPVLLLVVLNCLLLYYLRASRLELRRLGSKTTIKCEWKVTSTVFFIVIALLIFNIPSVVYYWMSTLFGFNSNAIAFLLNFLIVVSKALNFLLYCATSSAFRSRLLKIFLARNSNRSSMKKSRKSDEKLYTLKPMKNNSYNVNTSSRSKAYKCYSLEMRPFCDPVVKHNSSGRKHSSDILL